MIRAIDGWHQDDEGHWVAELSCLHGQHVRHQPPFFDRPWVLSEEGRSAQRETGLDCPLCDRAELPEDLAVARTAGPWDETTLPSALQRAHLVADRTWGRVRVLDGAVGFSMEVSPRLERRLAAGDAQPIPPRVPHALSLTGGPVRLVVDFLVRATT